VTSLARHLLLPALCFSLCGCGVVSRNLHSHGEKEKDKEDPKPKDLFIGVVEMVNPEQHFVLIRTGIQLKLQPGWKLETRPVSGSKSVLVITPEQKQNFLSADIAEGYPQQGEMVVMPPQLSGFSTANITPANPESGQAPSAPAQSKPPPGPIHAPTGEELPPPIP
jgi:hypothetical protein